MIHCCDYSSQFKLHLRFETSMQIALSNYCLFYGFSFEAEHGRNANLILHVFCLPLLERRQLSTWKNINLSP